MEQNKGQSSAAVSGEAVAEFKLLPVKPTEAMYLAACHAFRAWRYSNSSITPNESNFTHNDVYAAMVSAAPHAPVSARAADAPSEPSETISLDDLSALLPGPYYMDPPDGGSVHVMEQLRRMADDAAKWRATDALDSQPTEPSADVRARVRDAVWEQIKGNYYCGRVWDAWQVGTMTQDDFEPSEDNDEVLDNITDAVIAAVSSQPTDGGVRNG